MTDSIGLYLKDIKKIPLLSREEEYRLAVKAGKGDAKARREIIQANLRLVINIAKRYGHLGVPFPDLVEEGNLGIIRAVSKFNPRRGYRFTTYAAWWIRQYITRAIADQGKVIRVPVYMSELISRWRKVTESLTQKMSRPPTDREVARRLKVPIKKVRDVNRLMFETSSLDAPIGGEGDNQFIDILAAPAPRHDNIATFLRQEKVRELIELLSKREQEVFKLRYGLDDNVSRTLQETANCFHITRERVRQIENVALKKMKNWLGVEEERRVVRRRRKKRK